MTKQEIETKYKIKNRLFRKFVRLLKYGRGPQRKFLLKMMPKNGVCAEIGVERGEFSVQILKHTKPKKLYLIDSWNWGSNQLSGKKVYDTVLKTFGSIKSVDIIRSESSIASKQFPDSFFDWIYIDADHSYQSVKTDLELYFRTVKPNGFITGDDYKFMKHPDVQKAVNDFINEYPVTPIIIKNYQYILKKTAEHSSESVTKN